MCLLFGGGGGYCSPLLYTPSVLGSGYDCLCSGGAPAPYRWPATPTDSVVKTGEISLGAGQHRQTTVPSKWGFLGSFENLFSTVSLL